MVERNLKFETHGAISPRFLILHWYTFDPELDTFDKKCEVINPYGYHFMFNPEGGESNAGCWQQTAELEKVWHAGGSKGLKNANSNSIGISIPYMSPSKYQRGIDGEVELDFFNRQSRLMEKWWYPPISEELLRSGVELARRVFIDNGWQRVAVYAHHMINDEKNDIRNLGANAPSHGELNALFLK